MGYMTDCKFNSKKRHKSGYTLCFLGIREKDESNGRESEKKQLAEFTTLHVIGDLLGFMISLSIPPTID